MKKKILTIFSLVICLLFSTFIVSCAEKEEEEIDELSIVVANYAQEEGKIVKTIIEEDCDLNNKTYYKVKELSSGQTYLIGYLNGSDFVAIGSKDQGSEILYTLNTGGGSNSTTSSSLTVGKLNLSINDGSLVFEESSIENVSPQSGEIKTLKKKTSGLWTFSDGILSYTSSSNIYYVSYSNGTFSATSNEDEATILNLFTNGDDLSKCIETQMETSDYVYASSFSAPTYALKTYDGITIDNVIWNLNGTEYDLDELSFSPTDVEDIGYGVYPIYALIEGHDSDNYYYKETSYIVNFIVVNGVLENSVLTFSDIHEQFYMIGDAIQETMDQNDGKIPSLVLCTGDWVNGATPEDEVLSSVYLPQIKGQIGGIDAVYVAGNHESYLSVAKASIEADLGADESNLDGIGVIFDSRSSAAQTNGKSSLSASGLIVFGINYFSLGAEDSDGNTIYTYNETITQHNEFLDELKDSYNRELIIISAHAGLHTLGVDPHSNVSGEFSGNAEYNINLSNEMVDLLNYYAEEYGMNFSFLFGHNHSKGEEEFTLVPYDRIYSTYSYSDKIVYNKQIYFSYAHSGYLSTEIGSADAHYTLITWDSDNYYLNFKNLEGTTIITTVEKN